MSDSTNRRTEDAANVAPTVRAAARSPLDRLVGLPRRRDLEVGQHLVRRSGISPWPSPSRSPCGAWPNRWARTKVDLTSPAQVRGEFSPRTNWAWCWWAPYRRSRAGATGAIVSRPVVGPRRRRRCPHRHRRLHRSDGSPRSSPKASTTRSSRRRAYALAILLIPGLLLLWYNLIPLRHRGKRFLVDDFGEVRTKVRDGWRSLQPQRFTTATADGTTITFDGARGEPKLVLPSIGSTRSSMGATHRQAQCRVLHRALTARGFTVEESGPAGSPHTGTTVRRPILSRNETLGRSGIRALRHRPRRSGAVLRRGTGDGEDPRRTRPPRLLPMRAGSRAPLQRRRHPGAARSGRTCTRPPHGMTGEGHLCFAASAEEIDQWKARLTTAGVDIEADFVWPMGGRSIYFRDPRGTHSSSPSRGSGTFDPLPPPPPCSRPPFCGARRGWRRPTHRR